MPHLVFHLRAATKNGVVAVVKVAQVANLAVERAIAAPKSATIAKGGKGSKDQAVIVCSGRSSVTKHAILDRKVNQWRLRQRLHRILQRSRIL